MKTNIILLFLIFALGCNSNSSNNAESSQVDHKDKQEQKSTYKNVTAKDCPEIRVRNPHPIARMDILPEGAAQVLLQDCRVLKISGDAWNSSMHYVSYVPDVIAYDRVENKWTKLANIPVPLNSHTATVLGDGRVLVVGGFTAKDVPFKGALVYNPTTNTWDQATPPLRHIRYAKSIMLNDGRIFFSGENGSEIYNPITDSWTSLSDMFHYDPVLNIFSLHSGNILVVHKDTGGHINSDYYDFKSGKWVDTHLSGYDGLAGQLLDQNVALVQLDSVDREVLNIMAFDENSLGWTVIQSVKPFKMNFKLSEGLLSQLDKGKLVYWGNYENWYTGFEIDLLNGTKSEFGRMQSGINFNPPNQPIWISPREFLITPNLESEIISASSKLPTANDVELPKDNGSKFEKSFHNLKQGDSVQEQYTIYNNSDAPFELGVLETFYYNFIEAQNNCPVILAPQEKCSINLTFKAVEWGEVSGQGARFTKGKANFWFEFYAKIQPK